MRKKGPGKIHGFLLVDKPENISSAQAVSKIKKHFDLSKVGHTGTLDPFASGLLVMAIGHATKLSSFFLEGDKSYEATLCFGQKTDTLDRTGEVIETAPFPRTDVITKTLDQFLGTIEQIPPMYSAVKVKGEALYKKARRGEVIERKKRKVKVHRLELSSLEENKQKRAERAQIQVSCGGGTYIRSLASDWAEASGSLAFLETLRRTQVKGFSVEDALDVENLGAEGKNLTDQKSFISFSDSRLSFIRRIAVEDEIIERLKRGDQSPLESGHIQTQLLDEGGSQGQCKGESVSFLLSSSGLGAALVAVQAEQIYLKKVLA